MPTIRLPSEARAMDIDADGLAMQVRLTSHEVTQLWSGASLSVADGTASRLAACLGLTLAALVVGGASSANDPVGRAANEDSDPVYDDGPSVMASAPERGARAAEPESIDAQEVLDQVVLDSDGRYNDEDAELVAAVLSAGEMPPTLTARELPAFLRAWLEPACALRALGRTTPELLLVRVVEDGPKNAANHALRAGSRGATRCWSAEPSRSCTAGADPSTFTSICTCSSPMVCGAARPTEQRRRSSPRARRAARTRRE